MSLEERTSDLVSNQTLQSREHNAPKDPVKKREHFYIMRNKDIASSPDFDGCGRCYIYEDMGRLIDSARLTGGVSDERMLGLLENTEGFRKMIHSIGVSVLLDSDSTSKNVRFIFQMYGKSDVYGSGTKIICDLPANGTEYIINLDSDVNWSDDDNEPGQIIYEFDELSLTAETSVCFYLNDGFTAPLVEDENPIDFESEQYASMIKKSLLQQGNNYRIKKAFEKARKGEDTTIAFIGGSITQGAGAVPINTKCYARKIFEGFCEIAGRATDDNVHYIKAGVGGTPSELGMLRYKTDILDERIPDVVIVEFAVNDGDDETEGECYDSLVRQIYDGPGHPAVILLFAVFSDDFNLQDRLSPVGRAYNLPMVSTKDSVVEQFYKKAGEGRIVTKNQFFYDRYHPTNVGHKIMADGVINMLKLADLANADEELSSLKGIKAPIGNDFESVIRLDRTVIDNANCDKKDSKASVIVDCGSFFSTDTDIQGAEHNMDLNLSYQFADNWMHDPSKREGEFRPFTMELECRILLMVFKDSADNSVGKAEVYVDGNRTYYADPREVGWTHCHAAIIYRDDISCKHHVEIHMADGSQDKSFTLLAFGIVK